MSDICYVPSLVPNTLGVGAYHKLSTRKFTQMRSRPSVEQPQKASRLMSNTPVMVLYIISDNRGSGRQAGSRWRSILRLLSLGWSTEGHIPYSAQVLQSPSNGDCHA